ncbi:FAD-dependent monooxygenase [Dactylosporangium sp. AC04546]|uniref:FAD-dependent monooxygenase n=1 Tax=Dactylosporangium sp. AC04546 TaxID=2862460 RepID=UPI001EDF5C9F|nr:FAD-dependent monooxygenase [Dactylosporangium sp. AC04546]WVK80844.1 FAD-dependent monooxygenase [Dactylosporangium sp. AC04546]
MNDQILIVGGGIGGVATALACARKGIAVRVLERAPVIAEVGAGLQVGPNAWRALTSLGVIGRLERSAVLPRRAVMLDVTTGEEITSLGFGPEFVSRYGAPYAVMHRGDLLTALIEECKATGLVTLEPGKEVVDLTQTADEVTVRCADGSTYRAAAVIGADGLRSTVRRFLLGEEAPLVSRYVVYRGTIPRPAHAEDAVMLWVGDKIHYIQYPVRGGQVLNQVASFASDRGDPGADDWGTPEELTERFAGVCEYVRDGMRSLDTAKRWLLHDRRPAAGWAQGRVVLLGDAAHPMQQYLAQGACQALEDAVALGEAVAASPDDLPGALQKFEAVRYPRAAAVQQVTRYFGEICHLGGVPGTLRNHVLGARTATDYGHVDWLYSAHSDDAVPVLPQLPAHLNLYPHELAREIR